jgi:hypothetical protein
LGDLNKKVEIRVQAERIPLDTNGEVGGAIVYVMLSTSGALAQREEYKTTCKHKLQSFKEVKALVDQHAVDCVATRERANPKRQTT